MSSAANASSGRWWPAGLLAVGLVSIALLIGSDGLRQRGRLRETSQLRALSEVERDVAVSHLWLEELVAGDAVPQAEALDGLQRSRRVVAVLLGDGGDGGPPGLHAVADQTLRDRTRVLARRLDDFRRLSEQRRRGYEAGLPVGVGSAMDAQCDALFAVILDLTRELRVALEIGAASRQRRSRLMTAGVAVAWGAILAAAAAALRSRDRQRRRTEEALSASQAQLLQSQKLDAVGRIAGGLAHDINNYLAAIRGHCELVLMKHASDPAVARKMDAAIRTVIKASALIDRLLAFGHAQPIQLEVLSLNTVLDGLGHMLRPTLGDSIRVERRLAERLWRVEIDRSQIEQVVVNLVVNARDAMPAGGEIVLSTANLRRAAAALHGLTGEHVELAVADTGPGIAPADRDKIFEPFWTTKEQSGHSGLGLATVYSIVQHHGGAIEVDGNEVGDARADGAKGEGKAGRGTTFRIFLPRSKKPASRVADDSGVLAAAAGGSERLLLVDDHPEFRESTRALLETLGYRVLAAANGDEALALFEREGDTVDLVVTDVVMPGLSGPELAARLRRRRPVKVIFMSGYTEDVVLRHGVEHGEVTFVKKQSSPAGLARRVREVLDGEPGPE